MKEILTVSLGQAGVQVSTAIWELLIAEHGIDVTGIIDDTKQSEDYQINHDSFFSRTLKDRYVPRTVVADLEPTVLDEIRSGYYRPLFHPDNLISGLEDAANNFARGFFTVGRLITDLASDQIRKHFENCDRCQALFIVRSYGGGTGSGLTAAMFDYLVDYSKVQRIEIPVYPAPTLSTCIVEPYNCLLSSHFSNDDIDLSLFVDNEALYDLVSKSLGLATPNFANLNRLISQVINSITSTLRFPSILDNDILALVTNLVPYPRIHYPLVNYAPLAGYIKSSHSSNSVKDITREVFERDNQLVKCDPICARYMACALVYRGDCSPKKACDAVNQIKTKKNIEFVDWCPTGFKMVICQQGPTTIASSLIAETARNVTMLCNSSSIAQAFQRICHKFHIMYSKRSFVHWFVGEGMEENEFSEAYCNVTSIIKDYEEAVKTSDELENSPNDNVQETETKVNEDTAPQTETENAGEEES